MRARSLKKTKTKKKKDTLILRIRNGQLKFIEWLMSK